MEESSEPTVDPRLRRLWEQPIPPRRGPRPTLSVERIVETAWEVADAEGLGAVSMARLGQELGCTAMALYRHIAGKDELLVLLADRLGAELGDLPDGLTWRDGLELWVRWQIEEVGKHPWFLDLPLTTVPVGPHRVRWLDQGFKAMRDLDLPAGEKLRIIGLLAQHVLGEARVQVETRRAAATSVRRAQNLPDDTPEADLDPAALAAANPYADFEVVLSRYADPDRLPDLFAAFGEFAAADAETLDADLTAEDDIGFGITVILDGVEAYVNRQRSKR